jgi:PPOX class probable F420-dependent enzyme
MVHLSTSNPDGSPQVTVIWIGLDGGNLVSTHIRDNVKLRNIRRDPRVALSFDLPREPGVWINPYAVLYAWATVEPSARIWDLMTKHAKVYVAPDAEVPASEGSEDGFIVRYSITRIGGICPWTNSPALWLIRPVGAPRLGVWGSAEGGSKGTSSWMGVSSSGYRA